MKAWLWLRGPSWLWVRRCTKLKHSIKLSKCRQADDYHTGHLTRLSHWALS